MQFVKFISHGHYTSDVEYCLPLVTGIEPKAYVMTVMKPKKAAGKLLITTLDPDYHSVYGYAKNGMEFNPDALSLFQNIIIWANKQAEIQSAFMKWIRFLLGITKRSIINILLLLSLSTCLLTILAFLFKFVSEDTFAKVGSVSSILSLSLFIVSKIIERK